MTDAEQRAWIATTREPAVDPDRRIIDAHHHLWDRGPDQRYLIDEYLADAASHHVTQSVFVECSTCYRDSGPEQLRPVGETEFVAAQAGAGDGRSPRVAGIVAFADLTLGDDVDEVLAAHEQAGGGRFRGVRHRATWDPRLAIHGGERRHAAAMSTAALRRGAARLAAGGYTLDLWAYHPQLADAADLADAVGQTTIVLGHLGGPLGIAPFTDRAAMRAEWQQGMRRLASCPNVVVKLGGVGMDMLFGMGWATRPQPVGSDEVVAWWGDDIRWCIDTFGPSRCMFESNYPADRQALGYAVIWNAFQKMAARYTSAEQDELFAGTAGRVYRID